MKLFCFLLSAFCLSASAMPPGMMMPRVGGTNLVGHWTFNEGSGTNAADVGGFRNNAVLVSSPTWSSGIISSAVRLTSGLDYLNSGFVPSSWLTQLTVSAWCKADDLGTGSSDTRTLFGGLDGGASNRLYLRTEGAGVFRVGLGTFNVVTSNAFVSTNRWFHAVLTFDRTNQPTLYVNGTNFGMSTASFTSSNIYYPSFRVPFGSLFSDETTRVSGSHELNGFLDDITVFNRVLSESEVLQKYNNGSGTHQ